MRIDIFATKADLLPGLEPAESQHSLKYALMGMFKSSAIGPILSALTIEDLGVAHHGDGNHEKTYLVVDAAVEILVREVHQREGSVRYAVDLLANPTGFAFRPGGLFEDRCLISGYIGTATGNRCSITLCRAFIREVTRGFTKIHSYYIGPEALRLLDEGVRLTASMRSPAAYDITR